jgi:Carboxypeptidase regulatory-like domain
LLLGLVLALVAGLWTHHVVTSTPADTTAEGEVAPHRTIGPDFAEALAGRKRSGKFGITGNQDDGVDVTGSVIDIQDQNHHTVGNVEVVFKSSIGEASATTDADGVYRIHVPVGTYRAFVRDDAVLSVGVADRVRLPGMPAADTAGAPDEALMPFVVASANVEGVDLSVIRGGHIVGHVFDRAGHPIAGAVLRARGRVLRPALGTDIAESDADGSFEMRVPVGEYEVDASHPRFAGVAGAARVSVEPGDHVHTTLTLTAGCVISGRVVRKDGSVAGDGAIEKQWGTADSEFGPAGRIEPDGTFRWATTDEVDVTLRAWPWKSPPAKPRRFTCRDGARFDNVVFQLDDRSPDLEGVVVDKGGAPVPFTFVDLAPLDDGGIAQQERTDAGGRWEVYAMPAGRYRVTAQAPERGIAVVTISAPAKSIKLVLGGTGRLEGTATNLANGSFELMLHGCVDGNGAIQLARQHRIVNIEGGRFVIDDVIACDLMYEGTWHGHATNGRIVVPADGTAHITLDLGPPREKQVEGVVRDRESRPIANALVTSTLEDKTTTAKTDDAGHYALSTFSGASLYVANGSLEGRATVGLANVASEQVDIELGPDVTID